LVRQGGPQTAPRFLKCCGLKCALACQRQPADKSLPVSERSCLEKMVSDFPSALVDGGRIKTLYRVCHTGVQLLSTWGRDAYNQRLSHKFVSEGERLLRSLSTRDDYSHLLRLLDCGEKLINVDLAHKGQELKAETAPDYCCCSQRMPFIFVQPPQATTDNQANVFRNVDFVDLNVRAELAGRIEDFSLFDQVPV
jgi:hypothetical protein